MSCLFKTKSTLTWTESSTESAQLWHVAFNVKGQRPRNTMRARRLASAALVLAWWCDAAAAPLPSLPHELWLLILEFVARRELGAALPA